MPTLTWISESAEKALEWLRPIRVPPIGPLLTCPLCQYATASRREMFEHLSTAHIGERPVLLIEGHEPGRSEELYTVPKAGSIEVSNVTGIAVRSNGKSVPVHSPARLSTFLAGQRDARIEIDLENAYHVNATPLRQSYRLDLLVPSADELDEVDRLFVKHLAIEQIDFGDVGQFLESIPSTRTARQYADRLADYARAVLIKDRPTHATVTVDYAEYRKLYQRAQAVLRHFDRPIPRLICGAVRFALNDFQDARRPSGCAPLDAAAMLLAALISDGTNRVLPEWPSLAKDGTDKAPIDEGVWRVVLLAARLARARKWTAVLEEECRQAAEATSLDVSDRHKVLALWAGAALRLGIDAAAQEPLAQLSGSYPFARWASKERERSSS